MKKVPIRKLSPETASQIAAGEVVENPASVVKELIENALDAGAKRIRVLLKKGGMQEITVIDDGSGIPAHELRLALERHATSKIKDIDDLSTVRTLGFRGEALPSISSVAKISITSRQYREETGVSIYLEGGIEKSFQEVGFPLGTRVTVQDLFFNIPARRKFLKGISAETAKVSRVMQVLALSRPDVSFTLKREKGVLWETPGDGELINVIVTLFGHEIGRQLIPLHFTENDYHLNGYVGNPYFLNNRVISSFVNGRVVQSKPQESLWIKAIRPGHGEKIPCCVSFPFLPADIDVNIHPSKQKFGCMMKICALFLINSLNTAKRKKIPAYNAIN